MIASYPQILPNLVACFIPCFTWLGSERLGTRSELLRQHHLCQRFPAGQFDQRIGERGQASSWLLYVSDHGKSTSAARFGKFMHGMITHQVVEVPMLMWVSPLYEQAHAGKLAGLKSHLGPPLQRLLHLSHPARHGRPCLPGLQDPAQCGLSTLCFRRASGRQRQRRGL